MLKQRRPPRLTDDNAGNAGQNKTSELTPTPLIDELTESQQQQLASIAEHAEEPYGKLAAYNAERWPSELRPTFDAILDALPEGRLESGTKRDAARLETVRTFEETARSCGYGLAYFNGQPNLYVRTHWQHLNPKAFGCTLQEASERMGYPPERAMANTECDALTETAKQRYDKHIDSNAKEALVNCTNGTLVVPIDSEPYLREHCPEDYLTYCLPYAYDAKASCPKFLEFLAEVLPDQQRQDVLAEAVGAAFTDIKLEKAVLLYGSGANGKSVFSDIVRQLLGPNNVGALTLADLANDHNRLPLVNYRLNFPSEMGGAKGIDADLLKQLVSGEPVTANPKYRDAVVMTRYARMMFSTNTLPPNPEATDAYYRRFLIIPFDVTIPKDERNPDLASGIIADELPGILNWVLRGLARLQTQRKYSKCDASDAAVEEYRTDSDSVAAWLDSGDVQRSEMTDVRLGDMYVLYQQFCAASGRKPVATGKLRGRLQGLGVAAKRKERGGWHVALRATSDRI